MREQFVYVIRREDNYFIVGIYKSKRKALREAKRMRLDTDLDFTYSEYMGRIMNLGYANFGSIHVKRITLE